MKIFYFSSYQRLFLFPAPALNLLFAIKGSVNTVVFFPIKEFYRQSFACIICAFSVFVLLQSQLKVVGTTGIVGVIGTKQDVHIAFHESKVWKMLIDISLAEYSIQAKNNFHHQNIISDNSINKFHLAEFNKLHIINYFMLFGSQLGVPLPP